MHYISGRAYLVGSLLLFIRARKNVLDTEAELRVLLADDISSMDEALEVAKYYGITSVSRPLKLRSRRQLAKLVRQQAKE